MFRAVLEPEYRVCQHRLAPAEVLPELEGHGPRRDAVDLQHWHCYHDLGDRSLLSCQNWPRDLSDQTLVQRDAVLSAGAALNGV